MSDARVALLMTIHENLLPYLSERDFVSVEIPLSERSSETELMFPLGYMRRNRGTNVELLEIQFDRRGSAKFVLNFGVVPPEGATLPWRHYSQDEARVAALPEWYRLYGFRHFMIWFSPSWSLPWDVRAAGGLKTVKRVKLLYPEIENWFAAREIGPHIRRTGYPIAVRPQPNQGK